MKLVRTKSGNKLFFFSFSSFGRPFMSARERSNQRLERAIYRPFPHNWVVPFSGRWLPKISHAAGEPVVTLIFLGTRKIRSF